MRSARSVRPKLNAMPAQTRFGTEYRRIVRRDRSEFVELERKIRALGALRESEQNSLRCVEDKCRALAVECNHQPHLLVDTKSNFTCVQLHTFAGHLAIEALWL
jgi:hypothetical protein